MKIFKIFFFSLYVIHTCIATVYLLTSTHTQYTQVLANTGWYIFILYVNIVCTYAAPLCSCADCQKEFVEKKSFHIYMKYSLACRNANV